MRESHVIRRRQATNFAPAIRRAEQLGQPLNQFVTINFTKTQCNHKEISIIFAKIRKNYFNKWLVRPPKKLSAKKSGPAAFVWCIENTNNSISAHWLVHIPDERLQDFKCKLLNWVDKATGGITCEETVIDIKKAYNPYGARKYMLKGIDPLYAEMYKIRHIPQGIVFGKRFGFSRLLGPTPCREARTYYTQMLKDGYIPKHKKTKKGYCLAGQG